MLQWKPWLISVLAILVALAALLGELGLDCVDQLQW